MIQVIKTETYSEKPTPCQNQLESRLCFVIFFQGNTEGLTPVGVIVPRSQLFSEKMFRLRKKSKSSAFPNIFSLYVTRVLSQAVACCSCSSLKMSHVSEAIIHLLRKIGQGHHHNNQLTAITMSLKL